jgi:hypothetical protein
VLRHSAHRISFDTALVDRVVIVSPDRFGAAVASIQPGATHTNTETMVAAGKTFSRRDGNRIVSDIVYQSSLFENLAGVLGDPPTSTLWDVDSQQASYVICHEFGHALDNSLRNNVDSVPDPRAGLFSIKETADFYGDIVLTEYAACRNSAAAMTDPLFQHEMRETGTRLAECMRQVNHSLDNPEELTPRALAQFVCQGAWFGMMELAKFYGYATAKAEHREAIRELEAGLVNGTPLSDALDHIGASYPNWDIPSHIHELIAIWHTYASLSNVRFIASDDGPDVMEEMGEGN